MMKAEMKKKPKAAEAEPVNELRERCWAVISFDKVAARDLTYVEAERKLNQLEAAKVAGLCIVSNAVADRMPAV
jgi:hypothetical protein